MTPDEYRKLAREWEALQFKDSQLGLTESEIAAQLDIERRMEQSDCAFDEDGNLIEGSGPASTAN